MSSRASSAVASVIIRAWVEPDFGLKGLRARVLTITGQDGDVHEVDGAAAGLPAILELVEEALQTAFPIVDGQESSGSR